MSWTCSCPGVRKCRPSRSWPRRWGWRNPRYPKGESDCILCGKCVRMCQEVQHASAIGMMGRGAKREVMTPFGDFSQTCRTCGACLFVCPTGHINDLAKISGKTPKPKFSEFNARLVSQGNISRLYPQAVPATPSIDAEQLHRHQDRRLRPLFPGLSRRRH